MNADGVAVVNNPHPHPTPPKYTLGISSAFQMDQLTDLSMNKSSYRVSIPQPKIRKEEKKERGK